MDDFFKDLAEVYKKEIAALAEAGVSVSMMSGMEIGR
jgi:methionine synthase II (cobalamin-independent)